MRKQAKKNVPLPGSIYLLALCLFAMGTSEFLVVGLLTSIAADMNLTVAEASWSVSCFALGVVAGAPILAIIARGWSPRPALPRVSVTFCAYSARSCGVPFLFSIAGESTDRWRSVRILLEHELHKRGPDSWKTAAGKSALGSS